MKLNNNGWGLRVMIVFSCLFIFCLLIATIWSARMGLMNKQPIVEQANGKKVDIDEEENASYTDLEEKLKNSAQTYVSMEKINITSSIKIKYYELISKGYIDSLYDSNNKDCTGYVEVHGTDELSFEPFIKCESYETIGY